MGQTGREAYILVGNKVDESLVLLTEDGAVAQNARVEWADWVGSEQARR